MSLANLSHSPNSFQEIEEQREREKSNWQHFMKGPNKVYASQ